MKSKEELAKAYSKRVWKSGYRPAYPLTKYSEWDWANGFDAGFQRAVEMLRTDTSRLVILEHNTHQIAKCLADWLEKQHVLVPHESGEES